MSVPQSRYEYLVQSLDSKSLSQLELNRMGEQGWLLVATIPTVVFVRATREILPDRKDRPMLYTINQASKELGISRTKKYQLIYSGKLEVVRFGRSIRIPASELTRVSLPE